uniref:TOC34m n=1 Tax=Chlamydomonas reinhardtii TaxID=3055 RepID=D5LAZ4_CHLRE|nr:TOC34m [Chlamydomonas reinhardtii]
MAQPPRPAEEYDDDVQEDEDELKEGELDDDESHEAASEGGEAAAGDQEAEDEEQDEEDGDEDSQPWAGLNRLPEREDVLDMLNELRAEGRKQLTVLLLGKSSVGKSSLINSLLGEAVVRVQAFKLQADTDITTTVVRQVAVGNSEVDGFRLKLIDTCGLEDPEAGDTVNLGALSKIAEDVRGVGIDVVLYCDRLDLYRVDPLDKAIIDAISSTFGRGIWRRTVVALTHANLLQTPPGTDYDSFVNGRIRLIRGAVRGPLFFRPSLPVALVENSETCPVSSESGFRVLPDGEPWLVALVSQLLDMAAARRRPYKYHPRLSSKPSHRFRWLLPVAIAAEVLFYRRFLHPRLDNNQRRVEREEDRVWALRGQQRRALGLHSPHRPDKDAAWRLEQMYDDD